MNCDAAQRRLLAADRPDRPADDVRRHLAVCPACRLWGRRLVQVERQIPLLPVPTSSAQDAFVRRFQRTAGPVVRRLAVPWPTPAKERGLRKLSLAVAIAASLAVFTLGWWAGPHHAPGTVPPAVVARPFNAERLRRDHILTLPTARERVERLAELATNLKDKALLLTDAGDADRLAAVAALYSEVVGNDLILHAGALPAEERPAVLKAVAVQLGEAESAFHRLARDPASSTAGPLQELTLAAHNGGLRIQALLKVA